MTSVAQIAAERTKAETVNVRPFEHRRPARLPWNWTIT